MPIEDESRQDVINAMYDVVGVAGVALLKATAEIAVYHERLKTEMYALGKATGHSPAALDEVVNRLAVVGISRTDAFLWIIHRLKQS